VPAFFCAVAVQALFRAVAAPALLGAVCVIAFLHAVAWTFIGRFSFVGAAPIGQLPWRPSMLSSVVDRRAALLAFRGMCASPRLSLPCAQGARGNVGSRYCGLGSILDAAVHAAGRICIIQRWERRRRGVAQAAEEGWVQDCLIRELAAHAQLDLSLLV
jgi:hypothetical protein